MILFKVPCSADYESERDDYTIQIFIITTVYVFYKLQCLPNIFDNGLPVTDSNVLQNLHNLVLRLYIERIRRSKNYCLTKYLNIYGDNIYSSVRFSNAIIE